MSIFYRLEFEHDIIDVEIDHQEPGARVRFRLNDEDAWRTSDLRTMDAPKIQDFARLALAENFGDWRHVYVLYFVVEVQRMIDVADHPNDHWLVIQSEPGRTNMSHEVRFMGELGTTNDWRREAHGSFTSVGEARDCIRDITGGECYMWHDHADLDDPDVVEVWGYGRFPTMDRDGLCAYIAGADFSDITEATTDDELRELAAECITELERATHTTADADMLLRELQHVRDDKADEDDE